MQQETDNRYRERIDRFCLMDDTFMSAVFRNPKCVQKALRIILNDDEIVVREAETQVSVSNLYGRAIRMDVKAVLEGGKVCDVEVQRAKEGSSPKRARYYSSLLDLSIAKPGDKYQAFPETFVIFITEKDVLGDRLPIYHVERVITETGKLFGDGAHIIYVNGESRGVDTELGKLVHDFFCTKADDMYTKELADETRRLKETEEGDSYMCEIMEELIAEEIAEERKKMAIGMYQSGLNIETIAKIANVSAEIVTEWLKDADTPSAE